MNYTLLEIIKMKKLKNLQNKIFQKEKTKFINKKLKNIKKKFLKLFQNMQNIIKLILM